MHLELLGVVLWTDVTGSRRLMPWSADTGRLLKYTRLEAVSIVFEM